MEISNYKRRVKKSIGFTLLEVLIALVILALAFASLFMTISTQARDILYLRDKTAADWVALNVIAGAQLGFIDLNSEHSGTQNMFDKTWYWSLQMKSTENADTSQIEVEVSREKKQAPIIHLTGFLRND